MQPHSSESMAGSSSPEGARDYAIGMESDVAIFRDSSSALREPDLAVEKDRRSPTGQGQYCPSMGSAGQILPGPRIEKKVLRVFEHAAVSRR